MNTGVCKTCQLEKELIKGRRVCKDCYKEERKQINKKYNDIHRAQKNEHSRLFYAENKEQESKRKQEYYKNNQEAVKKRHKKYKLNNKDKIYTSNKKYRENNKIFINEKERLKRKNDINFRIRGNIRSLINLHLYRNGYSKNNKSSINYLNYNIEELKLHLEKQFEPWMNWDNQGKYNIKVWDDNDPSTWTWQIDHIIPQSDLPYTNMEDDNFKKCWALSNLRPYSAKLNIIEGSTRIRHRGSK